MITLDILPPVAVLVVVILVDVVSFVLVLSSVDGWLSVFPVCSIYVGSVLAYLRRRQPWPGYGSTCNAT